MYVGKSFHLLISSALSLMDIDNDQCGYFTNMICVYYIVDVSIAVMVRLMDYSICLRDDYFSLQISLRMKTWVSCYMHLYVTFIY